MCEPAAIARAPISVGQSPSGTQVVKHSVVPWTCGKILVRPGGVFEVVLFGEDHPDQGLGVLEDRLAEHALEQAHDLGAMKHGVVVLKHVLAL